MADTLPTFGGSCASISTEYRSILSAGTSTDSRPISRPILGRYVGRDSADISTDINQSVMGENDEVLGPAGEGRDDDSSKIDANLLLSKKKKKKKVKFSYSVKYICFQLSTLFTI